MPRKREYKFKGSNSAEEQLKRRILFTPCKDKQALHDWIHLFLGIDFPMTAVDVENGSVAPMDAIWDVYAHCLANNDYDYRRVLFLSSRDSGKCVVKGTKIIDKFKGLVNIEDVKVGDTIWSGKAWREVTDWIHDGLKPGYKAQLKNGLELTGSIIHRVWAWSPNKDRPDWKRVSELTTEDYVCSDTSSDFYKTPIIREEYDKGYLCGILQGDGCLTLMDDYNAVILSSLDTHTVDAFNYFVNKITGRAAKNKLGKRHSDWRINSAIFCEYLRSLGLKNCYAQEKEIPSFCYTSNSAMAGFISGLLDTDGHVSNKNSITLEITAEKLQKQLLVALHAMGVNATLYKKPNIPKLGNYHVWYVTINQTDLPALARAGVRISAKKAKNLYSIPSPQIYDAHDVIPLAQVSGLMNILNSLKPPHHSKRKKDRKVFKPNFQLIYPTVSRNKLLASLDWAEFHELLDTGTLQYWRIQLRNKWHRVVSAEQASEPMDFYDLTVEEDHSYWANGTINHNTLSAACLELLQVLHCRRNIVHIAAIEQQSRKSFEYLKTFLGQMIIRDYLETAKARQIDIVRYEHLKTKENITNEDWEQLGTDKQEEYERVHNYIKILVLTAQSTNSDHVPSMSIDECDLIEGDRVRAYEESKMILGVDQRGNLPITLIISTRKSMTGLVQKEVDNATRSGLIIHKWNILDITEPCPVSRHQPELPKIPIWHSDVLLSAVSDDEYTNLSPDKQDKYVRSEGFQGCLSNCKMFSYCKGRLATTERPPSSFYKQIGAVQGLFREVTPENAQSQLLCFGGDVQILMGDGTSKKIYEVQLGDKVITHLGNVRSVTKLFKREHCGKILSFNNPTRRGFIPTLVTSEHPYFVNGKEFKSIENLVPSISMNKQKRTSGDYLSFPKSYDITTSEEILYTDFVESEVIADSNGCIRLSRKTSSSVPIPAKYKLDKEFGWILGYFLAEGHFSRDPDHKDRLTAITFSSHSEEHLLHQKVRDFAARLGLKTSEFKSKQSDYGYSQDIYNTTLAPLFFALCGSLCDKKRINEKIMNAGLPFLEGILEGYYAGDGTKRENNYRELTTTSYSLATQLCLIASRLGLSPRIKQKPAEPHQKQVYLVEYQNTDYIYKFNRSKYKTTEEYNIYRFDGATTSDFSGFVYNIEVEADHSYIADGVAVHNCWKPSRAGLIYSRLERPIHVQSAAKIASMITGQPIEAFPNYSKQDLINLAIANGLSFFSGMDFGFSHNFAVVTAIKDGNRLFVVDLIAASELEISQKLDICNKKIKHLEPVIFADPEDPSSIKTFKKYGYHMRTMKKGKGSVIGGIDIVRGKLMPLMGPPQLFFLEDDDGIDLLFERMSRYHWKLDAAGDPTPTPDETQDDELTALRYLVMSLFPPKGKVADNAGHNFTPQARATQSAQDEYSEFFNDIIEERTANAPDPLPETDETAPKRGNRGNFWYDF